MIFLGFIIGFNLRSVMRQIGEDDEVIGDMGFWLLAWGLVGARVLFIIVNWSTYAADPLKIFKIWEGGLVFYGGFIGALLFHLGGQAVPNEPLAHSVISSSQASAGHVLGRLAAGAWLPLGAWVMFTITSAPPPLRGANCLSEAVDRQGRSPIRGCRRTVRGSRSLKGAAYSSTLICTRCNFVRESRASACSLF